MAEIHTEVLRQMDEYGIDRATAIENVADDLGLTWAECERLDAEGSR